MVFAKHYLNSEGMSYVINELFPSVKLLMSQQNGYISVVCAVCENSDDCVYITIKFRDQASFDVWVKHPKHDDLINALEIYRNRDYWEYAIVNKEDTSINLTINWQKVESLLNAEDSYD